MMNFHRFRWAELQMALFLDENSPFRLAEDVASKFDRLDKEVGLLILTWSMMRYIKRIHELVRMIGI